MGEKKDSFPKGVYYILGNIFFDRFSSGGFIGVIFEIFF
jgi:hypothetical protein